MESQEQIVLRTDEYQCFPQFHDLTSVWIKSDAGGLRAVSVLSC